MSRIFKIHTHLPSLTRHFKRSYVSWLFCPGHINYKGKKKKTQQTHSNHKPKTNHTPYLVKYSVSSKFLGTHSSCMHTFLKHLVTQCESQVRKLKIQFSIFKELPAAAPCLDFSRSRHLSASLALTLLQLGIPTEHKASLLTCNDLSLASQLLTTLIPTQNPNHVHKSWTGREEEAVCTQWNTHKLNLSLQIMLSY